jgi:hypothetical protein
MNSKETPSDKPARRAGPGNLLLWLLVLVSLLLNAMVINQLLRLRRAAQLAVVETSAMLADLQDETIALTIPIDQTIVLDTDLPIEETVTVPIRTDLPISTEVTVTVDAGLLGDIPLNVPIETTVPVNIMVDVPIDQTFAVHAPVELDLEVPVKIVVADTPLYDTLTDARQALDETATQLEGGLPRVRP